MSGQTSDPKTEAYWRDFLEHPDSLMTVGRHLFRRLPSDPRCQLCAAPFTGLGGSAMRMLGRRPSDGNPNMCNSCQSHLIRHHGGAEVDGAMLFADIRGSTAIAERMSATEYRGLLDRFYTVASQVVFAHGEIVNKFVGDELVAIFAPLMGANYSARALEAARDLLFRTGHADADGPWVPVGAGVHSGRAWFGAIGQGHNTAIDIVGDTVNTAARLAALADAGEILVSTAAADLAGLDPTLDRQQLELKGKSDRVEVVSIRVHGPS